MNTIKIVEQGGRFVNFMRDEEARNIVENNPSYREKIEKHLC